MEGSKGLDDYRTKLVQKKRKNDEANSNSIVFLFVHLSDNLKEVLITKTQKKKHKKRKKKGIYFILNQPPPHRTSYHKIKGQNCLLCHGDFTKTTLFTERAQKMLGNQGV